MSTYRIEVTRFYTPADKAQSDYAYLPFTLPQPARRLHVAYSYSAAMSSDQVEGGNVVDLGLFDPHGHAFPGGAGFRGWSGSARREFTIAADSATPGYLPGPLPAGQYEIILGLYRVWEAGVHVTAVIEADLVTSLPEPGPVAVTLPAQSPVDDPEHATLWLRGDLQSHTHHSDAHCSVEQLVAKARAAGLDFLAITDHNTVSHHPALAASEGDLVLIRGQECTTYYGHMNIWGVSRWCDFRCRTDADLAQVIALAHAEGGLCSINHPKVGGPSWEYSTDLPVDALEVWQGPWPHRNTESLALWDRLLMQGRRLPVVGGSDYHCRMDTPTYLQVGQPTTWVKAHARSAGAILAAIAAGRVCISHAPDGPRMELCATGATGHAEMGQELAVGSSEVIMVSVQVKGGAGHRLELVADGRVAYTAQLMQPATRIEVPLHVTRYVRAEIVGDCPTGQLPHDAPEPVDLADWRWALSNPIYVVPAASD